MDTKEKLDAIFDLRSAQDLLENDKQALINQVLTKEIRDKIAEIEAEFSNSDISEKINALTEEVKSEVVAAGETVKGTYLMAVYNKGRVSWDTKALDGYIKAHPEIESFRKQGDPSVSIRGI